MSDLQEDWGGVYDINLYCTDGIAKVIAQELSIAWDGYIQTGDKYLVFDIPLDRKHDAMLTEFFNASDPNNPETVPWYEWDEAKHDSLADKWQDYDTWGGVDDCVMPMITAGIRTGDELALSLAYWIETLPNYELVDYRKVAM